MSRVHIQVDAPKYEAALPARCTAQLFGMKSTAIIWESYIDHRKSSPVYLATVNGRYMMLPEDAVEEGSVKPISITRLEEHHV